MPVRRTREPLPVPAVWVAWVQDRRSVAHAIEQLRPMLLERRSVLSDRAWARSAIATLRYLGTCTEPKRVSGAEWVERFPPPC